MDPATLAASVAALLAPYLRKAGEEFVGEAGQYVQDKAHVLWELLRSKLDVDPRAKVVLDGFEKDPDAKGDEFKATIEDKLKADQPLSDVLAADVAEIKQKAPYVRVVQQMDEAEDLVGARSKRLKSGTVDVRQNVGKAKGVIGADIEEIG